MLFQQLVIELLLKVFESLSFVALARNESWLILGAGGSILDDSFQVIIVNVL